MSARFIQEIYGLRPWYHDFRRLGIQTKFPPERGWLLLYHSLHTALVHGSRAGKGSGVVSLSVLLRKVLRKAISGQKVDTTRRQMRQQARKEANILPYIARALDGLSDNTNPRILDLFCSDGYYGLSAKQMCPEASLVGVDISPQDIHRATVIAHYLDSDKTKFIADDVTEYVKHCERFDIVINTGGLYHIADPYRLLMSLRNVVGSYLVLQSAVTAAHNDPNYFEKPHPGWSWGSWFSHSRLQGWLNELGYQIIDTHSDAREGPNPAMIGGSYFLATFPERVR